MVMHTKLPLLYGVVLGLISGFAKIYFYYPSYSRTIPELLGYVPILSLLIGVGACMAHLRFTIQKEEGLPYKKVVGTGVKVALISSVVLGCILYFSNSFSLLFVYNAFTGNLVMGMVISFLCGLVFKKKPVL